MPARKIETEIAVGGERQFNDAMKGLNSNLKTLRSDMALTTAEFGKNDTSLQGLTKKQLILGQTISQQKEVSHRHLRPAWKRSRNNTVRTLPRPTRPASS